jgi:hypothetical protein
VAVPGRDAPTYHLQMRQFPHNHSRFNLSQGELDAIAQRWARGEWVELGERKWSPHLAQLTVLEGPSVPAAQLTMGRGWRNAERRCEDVTERVLAAAGGELASTIRSAPAPGQHEYALIADSVGLEVLSLLEHGDAPLADAWRLARERRRAGTASESLALAELAVRSLLDRGLITLLAVARDRGDESPQMLSPQEVEAAIAAPESWGGRDRADGGVIMRRT